MTFKLKLALTLLFTTIQAVASVPHDAESQSKLQVITDIAGDNTHSFEEQQQRFLRRPGAETVVSTEELDTKHLANLENLLVETPGVYSIGRGDQNSGLYSIRGTDIATSGPRNGRGIRAFIDGVPLGRTEAGLTVSLIDVLAADYVEVYRGANSLRFGAISAGGALNFISRSGKNHTGTRLSLERGAFGFQQLHLEHGGHSEVTDYYVSLSDNHAEGYRDHTATDTKRLSTNLGWSLQDNLDTRFFLTAGQDHQELADAIPFEEMEHHPRSAGRFAQAADTDRNFDYIRLANHTDWRLNHHNKLAFDAFLLHTQFDHLGSPSAGIVDNTWNEWGLGVRYDQEFTVLDIPSEFTGGLRVSLTNADFLRFRHRNSGRNRDRKVNDADLESTLLETYAEVAFNLSDSTRLFVGFQAVDIDRRLRDNFRQEIAPIAAGFDQERLLSLPQPGSSPLDQSYDIGYQTINPELGINWEFVANYFFFVSAARSYKIPTAHDVADITASGASARDLSPQTGWTYEVGMRGGNHRLFVDATLYYAPIDDEILTRRCNPAQGDDLSVCDETIAFSVDNTIHQGIELGLHITLLENLFSNGDHLESRTTWNYSDHRFDNDPQFNNNRLPVIPKHTLFTLLHYNHPSGFFAEVEHRYVGERGATYDGSGGSGWSVPHDSTWGMQLGYKAKHLPFSIYIQGTNLGDKIFPSTFIAEPTQPSSGITHGAIPTQHHQEFVDVRVANGSAWYAGISVDF